MSFYSVCVSRWLLKDGEGLLSKESARSCIDGSVFYKLAEKNDNKQVNDLQPLVPAAGAR